MEHWKALYEKVLAAIEDDEKIPSIAFLDTMKSAEYGWRSGMKKSIKIEFRKTVFKQFNTFEEISQEVTDEKSDERIVKFRRWILKSDAKI